MAVLTEGSPELLPPPAVAPPLRKRRSRVRGRSRHRRGLSRRDRRRLRRSLWLVVAMVGFFVVSGVFALLFAGPSALRAARQGRPALIAAQQAFLERDVEDARREFNRAKAVFGPAHRRLSSPLVRPVKLLPVVGTHLNVVRTLASVGERVADAGLAATGAMSELPDRELKLEEGRVDLAAVRRATRAFGGSVLAAEDIEQDLARMPSGWVIGFLDRARTEALEFLPAAVDGLRKGQTALEAMPSLFAETGRKRYLIAFSNLAELRGTGGFIGFVTVLKAENGKLELEDVSGRPTEMFPPPGETRAPVPDWFPLDLRNQARIFQNINLTTDFPTSGRLMAATATSALGRIDSVIGVDPIGIGAILDLIGPITIPSWPEPITADSVSRVAQHDVYRRIERNADRDTFFEQLVRTTFGRLVTIDSAFRPESFGSFDAAVRLGHFRMFSANTSDQSTFSALGLAGAVDRAAGANDVLSVVTHNATGNKADWFLRREIKYRVRLNPGDGVAETELDVRLRNDAPSSGLPRYIIGSSVPGIPVGTNRQNLMLVRSGSDRMESLAVNGRQQLGVRAPEGPLSAYRAALEVPARSSIDLSVSSVVSDAITGAGGERVYRLLVLPQPVIHADFAEIEIEVPPGWQVHGRRFYTGELRGDLLMEVRLTETRRGWLADKTLLGPWRAFRNLIGRIF